MKWLLIPLEDAPSGPGCLGCFAVLLIGVVVIIGMITGKIRLFGSQDSSKSPSGFANYSTPNNQAAQSPSSRNPPTAKGKNTAIISEPNYGIPSLKANVTLLRFFEGSTESLPRDQRVYRASFMRADSRYIYWELNLSHPSPGRRIEFTIEAIYHRSDGSVLARQMVNRYIDADWKTSYHSYGWGWPQPGNWSTGAYRVEFVIDGKAIATGRFDIYPDSRDTPIRSPIEAPRAPQGRIEERPESNDQQRRRGDKTGVIIRGAEEILDRIKRRKRN